MRFLCGLGICTSRPQGGAHCPSRRETGASPSVVSDTEIAASWRLTLEEVLPALRQVPGICSVKRDAGVGGVRADTRSVFAVDDTGVSAPLLADPQRRPLITTTSAAWDMSQARQTWV